MDLLMHGGNDILSFDTLGKIEERQRIGMGNNPMDRKKSHVL